MTLTSRLRIAKSPRFDANLGYPVGYLPCYAAIMAAVLILPCGAAGQAKAQSSETASQNETNPNNPDENKTSQTALTTELISDVFAKSSGGFSSDEMLINHERRKVFLANLAKAGVEVQTPDQERDALLFLLKTRKAGKLGVKATRRNPSADPAIRPVAEMAIRVLLDRHEVSTDVILADPRLSAELQHEAEKLSAGIDAYAVRRSVLTLRKTRSLKPELVLKVADWNRQIVTYHLKELEDALATNKIPTDPGVYLFRNREGYLYVGEASDLARRLTEHTLESDRPALAKLLSGDDAESVTVELHIFPGDSPAKRVSVRRAYESELIRSRVPKFNLRP